MLNEFKSVRARGSLHELFSHVLLNYSEAEHIGKHKEQGTNLRCALAHTRFLATYVSLFFFASFHSFSFFHHPIREFRDGDCGHGRGSSDGTGQCFPCIISPSAARAERRTLASPLARARFLHFSTLTATAVQRCSACGAFAKDIQRYRSGRGDNCWFET